MDILKIAFNNVFDVMKKTGRFDIRSFVDYMEPIFQKTGFRQNNDSYMESILVIRLDEIGDNVLTSGFLRELRSNYPQAYITLVVNRTVYSLVELCPYVNEVHSFDGSHRGNFLEKFAWAMDFCEKYLWKKYFSLCFCPRWDFDKYFTIFLAYMSGAQKRVGYSEKLYANKAKINAGFDLLLTKAIINPEEIVHEVSRNYFLLRAVGLHIGKDTLEIWYDKKDYLFAKNILSQYNFLKKSRNLVAVAIGANETNKVYPKEMYLEAFKELTQKGIYLLLLGGKDDYEANTFIVSNLRKGMAVNFAGKATLRQSCAIMSFASLYIGNDTGLKHIAAALNLPIIEVNREAEDCKKTIISLYERFFPWKTPAISLRPQHAIDKCGTVLSQGGCISEKPHCIAQINPQDIVTAYGTMRRVIYRNYI